MKNKISKSYSIKEFGRRVVDLKFLTFRGISFGGGASPVSYSLAKGKIYKSSILKGITNLRIRFISPSDLRVAGCFHIFGGFL